MPASDIGATYTSGRRPKAAKERTRRGWDAAGECCRALGYGDLADAEAERGSAMSFEAVGYLVGRQR